jgi:hypothetical protein
MEPSHGEKTTARRVQLLLYLLIALAIVVPLVIVWVRHR